MTITERRTRHMEPTLAGLLDTYTSTVRAIYMASPAQTSEWVLPIYVINLREDELKRNYIVLLMRKLKLSFTLVVVERPTSDIIDAISSRNAALSRSEIGCCLSHLWCLRHALRQRHRKMVILEDDVFLHADFVKKTNDLLTHGAFDFLLLGAHDRDTPLSGRTSPHYRPPDATRLYGAHANFYSATGARYMMHLHATRFSFFDKEYSLMFSHFPKTSAVCWPNLALANVSVSALGHSYPLMSAAERTYYRQCFGAFSHFPFHQYILLYIQLFATAELNDRDFAQCGDCMETLTHLVLYRHYHSSSYSRELIRRMTRAIHFFSPADIREMTRQT